MHYFQNNEITPNFSLKIRAGYTYQVSCIVAQQCWPCHKALVFTIFHWKLFIRKSNKNRLSACYYRAGNNEFCFLNQPV